MLEEDLERGRPRSPSSEESGDGEEEEESYFGEDIDRCYKDLLLCMPRTFFGFILCMFSPFTDWEC